jgi:hypothetical protein
VLEVESGRRQHRAQILHHPLGLRRRAARDQRTAGRVESDLPRQKDEIAVCDRLTVGADRVWRLISADGGR